jgi:hypothetical protein
MFKSKMFYLPLFVIAVTAAVAQERGRPKKMPKDAVSCNEYAPAVKQIFGQAVGIEQCSILSEETVFNIKGQKFRRVEVRLSGAVDGWASREKGSRAIYFTDGPDFVLAQSGLTGPRSRGVGKYEAASGHGLTIFYPEDARDWNGKLLCHRPRSRILWRYRRIGPARSRQEIQSARRPESLCRIDDR